MENIILSLGIWNWVVLGLILLILELVVSGVFLVWFGIAAVLTALVSWLFSKFTWFDHWQIQIALFLIFSVILVIAGRNFFRREKETDQPMLNQRTMQMIGQIATLQGPIVDGHGRVRIDDTIWRVKGDDAPTGTKVKLISFSDGAFLVEVI